MQIYLLFILVLLLYIKWILIILIYPFQLCFCQSYKKSGSIFFKVMSWPYRIIMRLTISGWDKYSIVNMGFIPSKHIRKCLYRGLGVSCGKNVVFRYATDIWAPYYLTIGEGSIIGDKNLLDARNGIEIGSNVNFSANVSIYTEQHDYRDLDFKCSDGKKKVKIGDRAWIGPNVIILPGVTIGEGAVCAAGCVVTRDVEPYTVVAGIPAMKISVRPTGLRYVFNGSESRIY